ncbi:hypothetical protein ACSAZL_00750 [Methanosarcina sp. T3]|uniref:hypothetical protein n=1 Tax=Methanosarcina sp. T3 TaxID=3439062 RepID=UPI003F8404B9
MLRNISNTGRSFSEWAKRTNRQVRGSIETTYKSYDLYENAIASIITKAAGCGSNGKNKIKKCVAAATPQAQNRGIKEVGCKPLKSNYTSNFKNFSRKIIPGKAKGV